MGEDEPKKVECPEYSGLLSALETVKTSSKNAAGALFKAFFAEYPDATAIGWTQYTPSFNDGDPCVFHTGEFYLSTSRDTDFAEVSSLDDDDGDGKGPFFDVYSLKSKPLAAALRRLSCSVDEYIFEQAFGNNVQVIATPAGFHVSDDDPN